METDINEEAGVTVYEVKEHSKIPETDATTDGARGQTESPERFGKNKNSNNGDGEDLTDSVTRRSGGNPHDPPKNKRKHRRGKPKAKNVKPYKNTKWSYHKPYRAAAGGIPQSSSTNSTPSNGGGGRQKLIRSRSLVPYNTNKFLMEYHLAEVPNALVTPSGRAHISFDSDDNYFYSLPEDEEEFLTKEFANVYERARSERLETLTKQELIEEILQMEDRYAAQNVGSQKQQQSLEHVTAEFMSKIRYLEEKNRELTKQNLELQRKLDMLPKQQQSDRMHTSSSEDSESDSSSSSDSDSSSCSSYSSADENLNSSSRMDSNNQSPDEVQQQVKDINGAASHLNGHHPHSDESRSRSPTPPVGVGERIPVDG